MVLRNVFIVTIGTIALAWSGLSAADEYRADEFLRLNLSKAVLSPKPLGPATGFTPGPLDVTVDRGNNPAQVNAEPSAARDVVARNVRVAHRRSEPPRFVARTKPAHHHRNPLDAQAFDARIQVWPCKSGGICSWKR